MEKYDLLDVPHLIYVMDPMCSWCYGFAPVLHRLKKEQEGKLNFKLVLGGLRPGTTEPMDEQMKAAVQQHWQEVEKATGQAFDFGFFERESFVYDTEPACRAVVTMRYLQADKELEMAEEVQRAFYARNNDVTKAAVLAEIAFKLGIEEDAFLEKFNSDEMKEKTKQDFQIARHLQADAFPSVYLLTGHHVNLLSRGYRLYDALKARLEEALKGSQPS
ncbi:DsbA family protein [Pontibacter sp. JH31]|uniref:DsbA family protein n=1 Tax=Pontibacter aquaedesilientis TaxID=2766980 RepID=A0ABR7XD74_9BACT|nr:DsbA family protein [Pontibacter aquaedesilientis]MBD1396237.1 DsbA family protein [Pontibacter aquaedesilientis]